MANVTTSNPRYVDATGSLSTSQDWISLITWAKATAGHDLIIKDNSGTTKILLSCKTTDDTVVVAFNPPLHSANGFNVTTIEGGVALLY